MLQSFHGFRMLECRLLLACRSVVRLRLATKVLLRCQYVLMMRRQIQPCLCLVPMDLMCIEVSRYLLEPERPERFDAFVEPLWFVMRLVGR